MSSYGLESNRQIPEPTFEIEPILNDMGQQIGEAKTCINPADLDVFQWLRKLDEHVLGSPEAVVLVQEVGRPTFISREAMIEISKIDPQVRAEHLMPYAKKATASSMVILTSNSTPVS